MQWVKRAPAGHERSVRCAAQNSPGASERYRCRACEIVANRDMNTATNVLPAERVAAGASTWAVRLCAALERYANVVLWRFRIFEFLTEEYYLSQERSRSEDYWVATIESE